MNEDKQSPKPEESEVQIKKLKGFAAWTPERRREASSKGGKAAHAMGKAHRFMAGDEKAREAGRKGGLAVHATRGRGKLAADAETR